MSNFTRIANAAVALFCTHEWTSRHEPHRLYLECMKCGRATPGIEIGRHAERRAEAPRTATLNLARRAA
ncbi:MAG: hypothetical protein H6Q08_237 [Acidobacteria bacterium]|nr:hypothetical protein [Acidobacteriota bacterium]